MSAAQTGEWLIIRDWSLDVRQITKVTAKLYKLGDGSRRYPTQISIGDPKIVCSAPDRETADRLRNSIAGIDGEYNRRRAAADEERRTCVNAANEAREKSIAALLASADRNPKGQDPAEGLGAEHESATGEAGDAQEEQR